MGKLRTNRNKEHVPLVERVLDYKELEELKSNKQQQCIIICNNTM